MEKQEGNRSMVSKVETKDQWELLFKIAQNKAYPMVVHFGATWCVPSVAMNPVFEELASKNSHVMFIFVDVDEVKASIILEGVFGRTLLYRYKLPPSFPPQTLIIANPMIGMHWEVASKFEVKAMPTFILMKDGVALDKLVGANPDEIKRRVEIFIQSNGTNMA